MSPISTAEMAQIRSDASNAACDLSCQIQRATRASDAQGGGSLTWTTIATVNAGMTSPTAGQLQNYGYIIGSLAAWRIQFTYGTDVQHGDRLVIGGKTLQVQVDLSPQSYNALVTVLATTVQ